MRVLAIEDNAGDYHLLEDAIETAQLAVELSRAVSLDEVLNRDGWSEDYDLLLLDLNLPGASWTETLARLGNELEGIPVIVLTGMNDEQVGLQAIRAGAQDYLIKGQYDKAELSRAVRHAVERFRLLSDLKKSREQEWLLANYDALTGLPNRRQFEYWLDQRLLEAKRNSDCLAVLFIDLDRFKLINDSLGHEIGDRLLCLVGQELRQTIRDEDTIARLGGDEFVLLLPSVRAPQSAAVVARKLLERLSRPFTIDDHVINIGCSIGIAHYPSDTRDRRQLIRFADLAMYQAKTHSGNHFSFYSKKLEQEAVRRMTLESNLRSALLNDELTLYFQPIVSLGDRQISKQEALVRWRRPNGDIIGPERFIPISEQSNLIIALDYWVLEQACVAAREWSGKPVTISVNLSARHFQRPQQLVERVLQVLSETRLAPPRLELEVTETALMPGSAEVNDALAALRLAGIRIAIDDFGVGYSSLNYLKTLPVDVIKVDRSFLNGVPENGRNAAITESIIQLGTRLGLEVVVEGVETRRQLDWLQGLDCGYAQGYWFAHPTPQPAPATMAV